MISTLYKINCSSFHPSPTIVFTRYFCIVECSLVQLSADIDFIYKDLTDIGYSMSRYRFTFIQQKRVSGLYVLSPLQVKFINKLDLSDFLSDTLPDYPDIMLGNCVNPDSLCVVMPSYKDDVLVLMGLSLTLFRLSHGHLPKEGYRIDNLVDSFYYSLQQIGKVDRLYKVDLNASLSIIPLSLLLEKVKSLVGDGSVYKLISSLLYLPIIHDDDNHRKDISCGGIPPVGEITKILFNIVLMEIFDREFPKRFPGIAFSRFIHEVFISTKCNDEVIFDEKAGYALLEELGLAGNIISIGPGDEPLPCYYTKMLFVDSDSKVHVCNPKEYY